MVGLTSAAIAACCVTVVLSLVCGLSDAAELRIDGTDKAAKDNVRRWLQDARLADVNGHIDLDLQTDANVRDAVFEALQPYGYYQPKFDVEPDRRIIRVLPGIRAVVRTIDVALTRDLEIKIKPEVKVGEPFLHTHYETSKRAVLGQLVAAGFLDATFKRSEAVVDAVGTGVDIRWQVDPGALYRFGELRYAGETLSPRIMSRFAGFASGDPFAYAKVLELHRRLRDSRYFRTIQIDPAPDQDRAVVDINVNLAAADSYELELGIGIGTDSGLGIEAEFERPQLGPGGSRIDGRIELAARRKVIGAALEVPSGSEAESRYRLALSVSDEESDAFDARSRVVSLSRLRPWRGWRRTDSVSFRNETSDLIDAPPNTSLLIPEWSVKRRFPEHLATPDSGYRMQILARGASDALASDVSFLQVELEGKRIASLSPRFRAILRGQLAYTATDDLGDLPATLRYFAGGDRSIRGYAYQSLSPVDADGEPLGAKGLIELSAELEARIRGPWRAALFVDAGNAVTEPGDDLEVGAGLGLRYTLPVGSIRLDVAWPVNNNDGPRLHLIFGPDL